jgi:uncharacterized protein (DUF1330 family)
MAAYLIVDTKIKDADAYEDYKRLARPIVESYGGEYLARGGEMTVPETSFGHQRVWSSFGFPLAARPRTS